MSAFMLEPEDLEPPRPERRPVRLVSTGLHPLEAVPPTHRTAQVSAWRSMPQRRRGTGQAYTLSLIRLTFIVETLLYLGEDCLDKPSTRRRATLDKAGVTPAHSKGQRDVQQGRYCTAFV